MAGVIMIRDGERIMNKYGENTGRNGRGVTVSGVRIVMTDIGENVTAECGMNGISGIRIMNIGLMSILVWEILILIIITNRMWRVCVLDCRSSGIKAGTV
jgi:hypothetical protein